MKGVATEGQQQTETSPPRCGDTPPFPKSRRTGKPCQAKPLKGASRCRFHGGRNQQTPKGGNPGTHQLYSRHLQPDQLAAWNAAAALKDTLDPEIQLARAKLDWAVQQWVEDPTGGLYKSRSDGEKVISETWIPWSEVVRMHTANVAKLVETRSRFCKTDPGSRPLATYKAFMKARQGQVQEPEPAKETEHDGAA